MNNQIIAFLTEHVVLTLSALIVGFLFMESLATIITKEPIMIEVLFLFHHSRLVLKLLVLLLLYFRQNVVSQLLLFLLCLFPDQLLLLCFPLFGFLSLLLPALRLDSHRVLDLSGILHYFVTIRLLKPKVILRLVLVHLHTALFVLLIDFLNLLRQFRTVNMLAEPLLVDNIISQKNISFVHLLRIRPDTLD